MPRDLYQLLVPADNPQTQEKIALGKTLFFDTRLSADNSTACATCHKPDLGFTDQLATSKGIHDQFGHRNAPTILNAVFNVTQFWDGRAPNLEEQAKLPILNPVGLGGRRRSRRRQGAGDTAFLPTGRGRQCGRRQEPGANRCARQAALYLCLHFRHHLYTKNLNERFVRGAPKAVDDVNALDPQPDFVLFGGDLAQLGRPDEMRLGAEILKELRPPVKMMVGEHDWFLDMGEMWQELFGPRSYSFDWKGVHVVTLMSVNEKDFWTARHMSPDERMHTVAGLEYQTQLQRVALLRDMINWCIENPVKGQPLSPDDPRLRALEAYIISQRNGTALAYGKH